VVVPIVVLCLLFGLAGVRPATASEPPRGSDERTAILDAMRPHVERDIGAPVVFRIERINREGAWAFVSATPQRPGSAPIDWSRTRFAKAFANDMMSDAVLVLLAREVGRWRVLEYALGPTDVTWEAWIGKYKLPRGFFAAGDPMHAMPPPPRR
jgi:hypothetical protein